MKQLTTFLEFELLRINEYKISVYTLVFIALTLTLTNGILWIIKKTLYRRENKQKLDIGNAYALYQIIKYIIWTISFGLILETIGIKLTILIAGSAALLVGVGLGLQQTFNDIVSGIILLSERSIKINDVLEIDGDIIQIQHIGLRTSKGLNRNEISLIIPNSLITTNKVINWSHQKKKTRFIINVGVAYDSDIDIVLKTLEESVLEHPNFSKDDFSEARLIDFGQSSLKFEVLFFSENVFRIEKTKSEIRKIIFQNFKKNNIKIPYPQMDLHVKPVGNNFPNY